MDSGRWCGLTIVIAAAATTADARRLRRQFLFWRLDPEQLICGDVERRGKLDGLPAGWLNAVGPVVGDGEPTDQVAGR